MKKEWNIVEIDLYVEIPFVWKTPEYGTAEFSVCQRFMCGKPIDYFVYPHQQQNDHTAWHMPRVAFDGISIKSEDYDNRPGVWDTSWCKEHNTVMLFVYVPRYSNVLRLDAYGLTFFRR